MPNPGGDLLLSPSHVYIHVIIDSNYMKLGLVSHSTAPIKENSMLRNIKTSALAGIS